MLSNTLGFIYKHDVMEMIVGWTLNKMKHGRNTGQCVTKIKLHVTSVARLSLKTKILQYERCLLATKRELCKTSVAR